MLVDGGVKTKLRHSSWPSMTLQCIPGNSVLLFLLIGMQTWITAVDENGHNLRLAWEPPVYLVDEKGCDFDAYGWPWTKTDIPDCSKNNGSSFPCMIMEHVGRACGKGLWSCATRRTKTNTDYNSSRIAVGIVTNQHVRLSVVANHFLSSTSRPELGPQQPPIQRIPRGSSHGVMVGGAWGSPHTTHLMLKSRMREAVPPPETYWYHGAQLNTNTTVPFYNVPYSTYSSLQRILCPKLADRDSKSVFVSPNVVTRGANVFQKSCSHPKILGTRRLSRKKLQHRAPTNISHHCTKFCSHGDLVPKSCPSLTGIRVFARSWSLGTVQSLTGSRSITLTSHLHPGPRLKVRLYGLSLVSMLSECAL